MIDDELSNASGLVTNASVKYLSASLCLNFIQIIHRNPSDVIVYHRHGLLVDTVVKVLGGTDTAHRLCNYHLLGHPGQA